MGVRSHLDAVSRNGDGDFHQILEVRDVGDGNVDFHQLCEVREKGEEKVRVDQEGREASGSAREASQSLRLYENVNLASEARPDHTKVRT